MSSQTCFVDFLVDPEFAMREDILFYCSYFVSVLSLPFECRHGLLEPCQLFSKWTYNRFKLTHLFLQSIDFDVLDLVFMEFVYILPIQIVNSIEELAIDDGCLLERYPVLVAKKFHSWIISDLIPYEFEVFALTVY